MPFFSTTWVCRSCNEDGDDELDVCYDGNAIVRITLQRDYLLLQLQDLVDSTTTEEADDAIQAIYKECYGKLKLQRFMVRAGTISILQGILQGTLQRPSKQSRPSTETANQLIRLLQSSSTTLEKGKTHP
mmetsp:Transcript_6710/g.16864  ORF Transcript_6710/g.16864 Transcript_6710/m.16864 type:complete len:130 (-) Transcript_6710:87-476(-)